MKRREFLMLTAALAGTITLTGYRRLSKYAMEKSHVDTVVEPAEPAYGSMLYGKGVYGGHRLYLPTTFRQ